MAPGRVHLAVLASAIHRLSASNRRRFGGLLLAAFGVRMSTRMRWRSTRLRARRGKVEFLAVLAPLVAYDYWAQGTACGGFIAIIVNTTCRAARRQPGLSRPSMARSDVLPSWVIGRCPGLCSLCQKSKTSEPWTRLDGAESAPE